MKHNFLRTISTKSSGLQLFTASPINQTKKYSNTLKFLKPTTNNVENNIKFKNGNLLGPYFPYGKSDFGSIRRSKQFYVDKTNLIPQFEEAGDQLFFVRPPRWGKSLLLSMLSSYYDINKKDSFGELFSGLWISDENNWTPGKNQYHILKLDFSIQVDGTLDDINQRLHTKINTTIEGFLEGYGMGGEMSINQNDSFDTYQKLIQLLVKKNAKLMVLIDEYDRFANKLMFENPEKYQLIVEGKRGDPTSPIRSFFEQLKWSAGTGLQDFRSLIVGITPIALADASGYNVSKNISFHKLFGNLVGLSETDLRIALNHINIVGIDQDTTISTMKKYYKGYHFPGSNHALFNTTLSMFFLDKLASDEDFRNAVLDNKHIPLSILTDTNTMISENVFATLASSSVVSNDIIQQLLSKDYIEVTESIYPSLKLREIIDPPSKEEDISKIRDNALSFMYYHGMITFTEESSKQMNPKQLLIPNEIAKVQYLEQLRRLISLRENDISTFINEPTQDNLKKLLWSILSKQETVFDNDMSEGGLQSCIESALRSYSLYRSKDFTLKAEKEYTKFNVNGKEYTELRADLVISTENDIFIIELKRERPMYLSQYSSIRIWKPYMFKEKFKELLQADESQLLNMLVFKQWANKYVKVETVLNEATSKVKQYAKKEQELLGNNDKTIHKFIVIQVGWPLIVRKVN